MLTIGKDESYESAWSRIRGPLEDTVRKVKNPPDGEHIQTLYVQAASPEGAAALQRGLVRELASFTAEKNSEGGWARHLTGTHRINVTAWHPSQTDLTDVVDITVAPVPVPAY